MECLSHLHFICVYANHLKNHRNLFYITGYSFSKHLGPERYLPSACQRGNKRKEVLHSVTGKFPKKGLVAIMGPSGSGKTTFLNALSNRMSIGGGGGMQASGLVKVNGQVVPPDYFYSKQVSFVPQDTCLFSELTPREAIRFSTALVYPNLKGDKIEAKVNKIMTALSLNKCADTQVGNEMFRGISGGERKRCVEKYMALIPFCLSIPKLSMSKV